MARPTDAELPRWAETSGGTPSGDIAEPTSGEKDAGFQSGDPADAEGMNWLLWKIYLWLKYWFTEERTLQLSAIAAVQTSGTWTRTGYSVNCTVGTGILKLSVPVEDDWTITGVEVQAKGDGAADFETFVELADTDPTSVPVGDVLGDTITSNAPASWAYYSVPCTDTVIAGKTLHIQIQTAANLSFGNIRVKFKH